MHEEGDSESVHEDNNKSHMTVEDSRSTLKHGIPNAKS